MTIELDLSLASATFWQTMTADQRKTMINISSKWDWLSLISCSNMHWICFLVLGDPNDSLYFSTMGVVFALAFANMGSAFGTAKSGVGIVNVAVVKPELVFKSIIPIVMAGVLGMYGMIISILMKQSSKFERSWPLVQIKTFILSILCLFLVTAVTFDQLKDPSTWNNTNWN